MPRGARKPLVLLLALLLATGFGVLGLMAGALPLAGMLHKGWGAPARQPVPAEVVESRLDPTRRSVSLHARYRYRFEGRTWESAQVGIEPALPAKRWQWRTAWHEQMQAARAQGRTIQAWVDPQAPHDAVLDRGIPWNKALFHLPFALVFTPMALAAAGVFLVLLFTPADCWPTADALASDRRVLRAAKWMAVGAWLALSLPMAIVLWTVPAPAWLRWAATAGAAVGGWQLVAASRALARRTRQTPRG